MEQFIAELSKETGYSFKPAKNGLAAVACHDPLVELSGVINTLAVSLMKTADDACSPAHWCGEVLGSWDRVHDAALANCYFRGNEPGSSIIPGKVNPIQREGKLQEIESKYIEADRKRSAMMMDFEKERAKWSLERDHLVVQEVIATLEKKKENLILENDKLKSERLARKPLYSAVSNSITSMGRYIPGKYKENYSGVKMSLEERRVARETGNSDTRSDYRAKELPK
eukprot:TRINITY_DN4076_c0_g1_i3.p1 TRINITY_DN4076_c0_g1~~TRINITY_DN4076_c0_g1_i3.p1  ORF type:complete len:227 (-),score=51.93 TRINITY_DN4076_c0_g1_i3:156-836(-)